MSNVLNSQEKEKICVLPDEGEVQVWQGLLSLQLNFFKLQTRFPKIDVHALNQKKKFWFLKFPPLRKEQGDSHLV